MWNAGAILVVILNEWLPELEISIIQILLCNYDWQTVVKNIYNNIIIIIINTFFPKYGCVFCVSN